MLSTYQSAPVSPEKAFQYGGLCVGSRSGTIYWWFFEAKHGNRGRNFGGTGRNPTVAPGASVFGTKLIWGCKRNVTPIFHCYLSFLDECQRFCFSLCLALF